MSLAKPGKYAKSTGTQLTASFRQPAQARQRLAVLLAVRRAFRAYDVRQRCHEHAGAAHLDGHRVPPKVVESFSSHRHECQVEIARAGREVEDCVRSEVVEELPRTVERQSIGNSLGPDPRMQTVQRTGKPVEIRFIRRRCDVDVQRHADIAMQHRSHPSDQDESDAFDRKGVKDSLGIELVIWHCAMLRGP